MCLLQRDIHSFILTCPRIVTRVRRVIFGWRVLANFVQACLGIACFNWSKVLAWFCTTCVRHLIRASWLTSTVQRSFSEFFCSITSEFSNFFSLSYCWTIGIILGLFPLVLVYQAIHRSWVIHIGFVHERLSNLSLVLFSHFLLFRQSLDCWRWWMVSIHVLFAVGLKADHVRTKHKFVGRTYVILYSSLCCGWSYALTTVSSTPSRVFT